MLALSLIKGPLVDDWTNDQIDQLEEKVTCAINPISQDNEVLWNEFVVELDSHFADTTRKQKAYGALQDLRMRGDDFDSYCATFKYLAKQAGFALTVDATIHLFALGLNPKLRTAIIARDQEPATMEDWITAAQTEMHKAAKLQTFNQPGTKKYAWVQAPQPQYRERNRHGRQRHPNDESVPMDVDPSIFTQVRRARTNDDVQRFKLEGRCFCCDKRGHMAKNCPDRKEQGFRPSPGPARKPFQAKPQNAPKRTEGFRKSNKPRAFNYVQQAQSAMIKEVEEEEEDYGEDEVDDLAAQTTRLNEDQHEHLLSSMIREDADF
jgi:hypothetical protein